MAYTTNKWVGLYLEVGASEGWTNTNMWQYLQANHWGLWLEPNFNTLWVASGGANNQAAALSNFETSVEPYLSTLNSYNIPVRLDLKPLEYGGGNSIVQYRGVIERSKPK